MTRLTFIDKRRGDHFRLWLDSFLNEHGNKPVIEFINEFVRPLDGTSYAKIASRFLDLLDEDVTKSYMSFNTWTDGFYTYDVNCEIWDVLYRMWIKQKKEDN